MWNPHKYKIWKEKKIHEIRPQPFHCHASAMDLPRYLRAAEDQPRPAGAGDRRQLMLQGFGAVAILEVGAGAQDPDLGLVGFGG